MEFFQSNNLTKGGMIIIIMLGRRGGNKDGVVISSMKW